MVITKRVLIPVYLAASVSFAALGGVWALANDRAKLISHDEQQATLLANQGPRIEQIELAQARMEAQFAYIERTLGRIETLLFEDHPRSPAGADASRTTAGKKDG